MSEEHDNDVCEENYDYDELVELYEVQKKIEKDIKKLWKEVMLRYIEDYSNKEILSNLNEDDYSKFYEYMVKNNTMYNYVLNRIKELEY